VIDMTKKTEVSILKPDLGAALDFATGGQKEGTSKTLAASQGQTTAKQEKPLKRPSKKVSGLVPEGDVRLTANISEEHHIKLKIAAAKQRTTIGELIEQLIDKAL
jgi:predicted HicB family RNase H-like nuclease